MTDRTILVMGGAHVDRRGRIAGETAPGASNPGAWFVEAGGGAFNAARNLARLGHRVRLVSPRGGDADGDIVAAAAEAAGVEDTPFIFLDRATPSYTAIIEREGDGYVGLCPELDIASQGDTVEEARRNINRTRIDLAAEAAQRATDRYRPLQQAPTHTLGFPCASCPISTTATSTPASNRRSFLPINRATAPPV